MPRIVERRNYDGALERIQRLGLSSLWEEIETIVTTFRLLITEERDANGGPQCEICSTPLSRTLAAGKN